MPVQEVVAFNSAIHPAAQELFLPEFEVIPFKVPKDRPADFDFAGTIHELGARVVGVRTDLKVDAGFLDTNPQVHTVVSFSTGTNHLDVSAANERGVALIRAEDEHVPSLVDLADTFIGAVLRRIGEHTVEMYEGNFPKTSEDSHERAGRTLGIFGYGKVGYKVAELARAKGMKIAIYDPYSELPCQEGEKLDTLEAVLEIADVLTLHPVLTEETKDSIDKHALARMKRGSSIVNVSRGELIVEEDLAEALENGHIAASAHDVFRDEKSRPFNSPLRKIKKALKTPHIGSNTEEGQLRIAVGTGARALRYVAKGDPKATYNILPRKKFPYVDPDAGETRVLFLHHGDSIGALASAAGSFAKHGISIGMHGGNHEGDYGFTFMDFGQGILKPDAIVSLAGLDCARRILVLSKELELIQALPNGRL
jgi:D-3-phosphoglycerate dehydrogenase